MAALQEHIDCKIILANERKHGTTHERPVDRLREEIVEFKPLPTLPYECEHYHEGTVRTDGHVRFQGKYYSVSEEYVRKDVIVLGNSKQVSIYHAGQLIEVHDRLTDRWRSKSTKPHHLKPWEQICDNPNGLRGLAAKIGPWVEAVVEHILRGGDGFVNYRRVWGILALNKKYSHAEINAACGNALDADSLYARTIVGFIEAARENAAVSEPGPTLPSGKFQRSPAEYKQILLTLTSKGGIYEH